MRLQAQSNVDEAASNRRHLSLIQDYGEGHSSCGYCSQAEETSSSYGMQAEFLTVETYQKLLDRYGNGSIIWNVHS